MKFLNLPERFLSWMIPTKSFISAAAIPTFLSGSGAATGSSLLGASGIQAGGNILGGVSQGMLSKAPQSETDKQQAANLKRKRDILNKWGYPVGQLGTVLGGYSAITGRASNPQAEAIRRQGQATGMSLMQGKVAPGQPGYQQAKQTAQNLSMQKQNQMNPSDMMGMMWALYMGSKALNEAQGR